MSFNRSEMQISTIKNTLGEDQQKNTCNIVIWWRQMSIYSENTHR